MKWRQKTWSSRRSGRSQKTRSKGKRNGIKVETWSEDKKYLLKAMDNEGKRGVV